VQAIALFIILINKDWHRLAAKAKLRMQKSALSRDILFDGLSLRSADVDSDSSIQF